MPFTAIMKPKINNILIISLYPYPLAEKYYGWNMYDYCMNNPIRFIDPDGQDAMIVGSGTKETPYVITANYYYQNGSLNEEQLKGLNSAISAYNNSGKNGLT